MLKNIHKPTQIYTPCPHSQMGFIELKYRSYFMGVHIDSNQENEFCHKEAAAQVLVNSGSGTLDLSKEPKGEDTHGETDNRDNHPQLRSEEHTV